MNTTAKKNGGGSSKIWARISPETGAQLRHMAKRSFRSHYQMVQHIMYSFIRVADIENADKDETLPPREMESIFDNLHSPVRDYGSVKPLRVAGRTREERKACAASVKVMANLTPKQRIRLDRIIRKYGFASNYEALQYAIACFVHALAGISPIVQDDTEIEDTFSTYEHAERHFEYIKPKRNRSAPTLDAWQY